MDKQGLEFNKTMFPIQSPLEFIEKQVAPFWSIGKFRMKVRKKCYTQSLHLLTLYVPNYTSNIIKITTTAIVIILVSINGFRSPRGVVEFLV